MNEKIKKILNAVLSFMKNTGEKIQDTHPFIQIVSFLVCAGIVFLLFLSVMFAPHQRRSVFYFPDAEKGVPRTEIRYLPNVKGRDSRLELYVSEVLLGPVSPGLSPLFNKGTKLVDCMVRKDTAYINLSSEVLDPESGVAGYKQANEIFKKNVCTNFRSIAKIYLYFDGIEVYGEDSSVDAELKK